MLMIFTEYTLRLLILIEELVYRSRYEHLESLSGKATYTIPEESMCG